MASSRRKRSTTRSVKNGSSGGAGAPSDLPTPPGTTGRYIVLIREGASDAGARMLERVAGIKVARARDFEGQVRLHGLSSGEAMMFDTLATVLVDADPDRMRALEAAADGAIVAMEPERIVHATNETLPALEGPMSSPTAVPGYFDYARGYRDAVNHLLGRIIGDRVAGNADAYDIRVEAIDESQVTWGLQVTNTPRSRFTGRGIRVAVLDTGFDLKHPDFAGRVVQAQSFVTGETAQDLHGHGTHCVGTSCGPRHPRSLPRYGIASDAEIFVGKVLDNRGSGSDGSILAGIDWATRKECQIVSMSLGAPSAPGAPPSSIFERVARRALAAGTLIIAAAGNDSSRPGDIRPVNHPANCPSIMAVGAVDMGLHIAPFSCGGLNSDGGQVDIAAPGVAVRSAWPRPELNRTISGTSMATPHVAGIAALFAEANANARGRSLYSLLVQSARRLNLPARDVGAGLVQAP